MRRREEIVGRWTTELRWLLPLYLRWEIRIELLLLRGLRLMLLTILWSLAICIQSFMGGDVATTMLGDLEDVGHESKGVIEFQKFLHRVRSAHTIDH